MRVVVEFLCELIGLLFNYDSSEKKFPEKLLIGIVSLVFFLICFSILILIIIQFNKFF